jgi:signal transduction histidine kinase
VRVTCTEDAIVAEIHNDISRGSDAGVAVPGAGHGLVGMRERVALYGGTLTAGPTLDGGFDVRADIPLAGQ